MVYVGNQCYYVLFLSKQNNLIQVFKMLQDPDFITIPETLSILKCSNSTLFKIRKDSEQKFPSPRKMISNTIYFKRNEVLA